MRIVNLGGITTTLAEVVRYLHQHPQAYVDVIWGTEDNFASIVATRFYTDHAEMAVVATVEDAAIVLDTPDATEFEIISLTMSEHPEDGNEANRYVLSEEGLRYAAEVADEVGVMEGGELARREKV